MNFIIKLILSAFSVFLTAYLLPGVKVESFWVAIVITIVLALLNTFLKPLLIILTIPATILTLGLFLFVINAFMVWIASKIIADFHINNFWWALAFSIVLSVFTAFFENTIN
ncbi:MAG: phage holin family protein [Cytophagales bacterium]|nr:phage holin family protein [Cytophagales bacterium]